MISLFDVANSLISILSRIRPVRLKQGLFSLLFSFYFHLSRLKAMLLQLRLRVFLVSGVEKSSGEKITLLFVGREDFPLFLKDMIFSKRPHIRQLGYVFVWRLNSGLHRFFVDVDAVLVSCDRFYRRFLYRDDFFVFPHMVDMVLDCSQGLDQIMMNVSDDAKREIKTVKNKDFSFEITSDIEKVSMFYHDMYVPTVENRIGKTDMFIPDFLALRFFLQMGSEVLLTLIDGSYVCGSFFYHHDEVLEVKYFGIYQGNVDLYRTRVSAADQYFSILVALERNVSCLDFGGARPFFNDGLFYYKQKWGMSVESYPLVPEVFGLKIINENVMKPFLLRNPFIGLSKDNRFVANVFVDKDTFSDEMRSKQEKTYKKPGIDEVRFINV
jgi:hypothetical protein